MSPMSTPSSASPASCCAGLRQTLLQGWQQNFPLHSSPFRLMAARSGATPRELLSLCVSLQRSGALQPVRARWGPALRRRRWRLGFTHGSGEQQLIAALAALPGCFRIERGEPGAVKAPTTWAELETLDDAALRRQLERLPQRATACLRLDDAEGGILACEDPQMAACIEQGLQLCAKPFAECARRLGCSEHRLLASLQAWRRSGQLECLTLKPPPTPVPLAGQLALWRDLSPSPAQLERLRGCHGVERVIEGPGTDDWPWRLVVVRRAAPVPGTETLRDLCAEAGLDAAPDVSTPLRISQPRDQALLFDTGS
jgi:hypothetical protein